MPARRLILAFGAFLVAFAAALWWFQTQAYYQRADAAGEVAARGEALAVSGYDGIDAPTSPLKMRACFRLEGEGVATLDALPAAEAPTPLVAPDWFECFDARALETGLAEGRLRAVRAERHVPWGFDRLIAYAPDGRAWMWPQMNACGRAKFDGDPLPEGCAPPPEDD